MQKKKIAKITSIVVALALVVGASFAYFTDYATTSTSGTSGTVAVSLDSDINLLDADGQDIINPGDQRDASFAVTNEGNKSIDVRTTVALTALDHEGNAINFTGDAATQSEYDLYLASDVELVEGKGYAPKAGAQPIQVKSIDGNVITYVLPEYSLNGNSDKYDEVETIDGVNAFTKDNEFVFVMKGAAGNEWQASSVMIDVLVEAKQHENTNAGWDIVAQETVTSGSINQNAVKGEDVITAGSVTYIPVSAKDSQGNDLNATSKVIEGAKADELLDALEESQLAQKDEVDALIEVESDDFEDLAETTFDVSEIAKEGDTVVILHYDETKQEWEYITTDTVDANLTVGGDFSSYSPVAIIVIPKDETPEAPQEPEVEKSTITFNTTYGGTGTLTIDVNGEAQIVSIVDGIGSIELEALEFTITGCNFRETGNDYVVTSAFSSDSKVVINNGSSTGNTLDVVLQDYGDYTIAVTVNAELTDENPGTGDSDFGGGF